MKNIEILPHPIPVPEHEIKFTFPNGFQTYYDKSTNKAFRYNYVDGQWKLTQVIKIINGQVKTIDVSQKLQDMFGDKFLRKSY